MPGECYHALVARPGTVLLESFELRPLAPDEALVQTTKTLISPGTERAILLNLPGLAVKYPKAVGYSHVGKVIDLGTDVTTLRVGDRVASKSRHASHVAVKASLCHRLPDDLADERATFFQLLATALQAVRKTRLEVGEAVAVLGAGLVGLLALQVARAAGALPTVAIDRDDGRLQLAKEIGSDHVFPAARAAQMFKDFNTLSQGFPVVIEATGNPAALESACQIAAFGGRIALLGSSRGVSESFDFYKRVHKRGISLIGAHISTGNRPSSAPGWWTLQDEQATALRLLAHKRISVSPLITHRYASSEIEKAYKLLAGWNLEAIGILLDWT